MSWKECSRICRSARIAAACSVYIKPMKADHQLKQGVAAEPSKHSDEPDAPCTQNDNNCHLVSLNDDCLRQIFGKLETKDLFAISDASRRFTNLAYQTAEKRFRKDEYICIPNNENNLLSDRFASYHMRFVAYSDSASMLIKFGQFITHLHIDGRSDFIVTCNRRQFNCWNFGEMINHCKSLKSLRFRNVELWRVQFAEAKRILRTIEMLEMTYYNCGNKIEN